VYCKEWRHSHFLNVLGILPKIKYICRTDKHLETIRSVSIMYVNNRMLRISYDEICFCHKMLSKLKYMKVKFDSIFFIYM
jgi:hypothetical protein